MSNAAQLLAGKLIRNFNDVAMELQVRAPLYESVGARSATAFRAIQRTSSTLDYWEGEP